MLKMFSIGLLLFGSLYAKQNVPSQLFGIELGKVYDVTDENHIGNIPVKKFTGLNQWVHMDYYFEPKKEYKMFRYVEKKEKPDDKFYTSSFSLYLFPVIPETIQSMTELKNLQRINYEIGGIRWSDGFDEEGKDKDNYFWAKELCKTFELDIIQKPEVLDYYKVGGSYWYQCKFTFEGRVLAIDGRSYRAISLDYAEEKFDNRIEAFENQMRLFNLKEIKPY